MRVTATVSLRNTMRDLSQSLERLQASQRQVSSGRAFERMSDDPRTTTDVLSMRGVLQRHDQLARTADDTRARLATADTTLVSASDALIRIEELTIRAANTGVSDAESRSALATEMRSLRSELLSAANTEYLGRPLFSGTAANAYDTATGVYQGDDTIEMRSVADGIDIAGNITGQQIFGNQASATGDIFAVLDRLATAIDSGDEAGIAAEQSNVQQARTRLGVSMAEVGRRVAQLEELETKSAMRRADLVERLSSLEDVDLAEAVIAVTSNDTAHQAALAAAARAMPPSLAQYLS